MWVVYGISNPAVITGWRAALPLRPVTRLVWVMLSIVTVTRQGYRYGPVWRIAIANTGGLFDETLLSNEDYEFNAHPPGRWKIWFDPRSHGILCTTKPGRVGTSILALWVLEGAHVEALSQHHPLAPGFTAIVCAGLVVLILLSPFTRWAGYGLAGILAVFNHLVSGGLTPQCKA